MTVSLNSKMVSNAGTFKKDKSVRTTKQGNPYYHTNACKKIGTGLSVASSVVGATMFGLMTKNPKVGLQYLGLGLLATLPAGIVGGAVIDGILNHHEKTKADKMAAYKA